jgi:uncharacterized protein YkwD
VSTRRQAWVGVVALSVGVASTLGLGLSLAPAARAEAKLSFRAHVESPRKAPIEARFAALHRLCGPPEQALVEVAQRSVDRQVAGGDILPADELSFSLRAAGDPHVWPRAWSISGTGLDDKEIERRLSAWVAGWTTLGVRRCAFAKHEKAGKVVFGAVALDALADVSPVPTSARVGQWITLEGQMLVPATQVKVVLLGPRGAPKTVLASLSGSKIKSTFSVDQPGQWLVQVLATVSVGPRPVLETVIFAGTTPPTTFQREAAPGEDDGKGVSDDAEALLKMMNAARKGEGLAALSRDKALDKLAAEHSRDMAKQKMIGHDVGQGDPGARVRGAGITARVAGENVASAGDVKGAHRALWASPSHRGNLLQRDFARVGVAVQKGADGRVYVTQLFVGG